MIQFLASNWIWIGFIVLMVVMHRSGHGCGGHGSHRHTSEEPAAKDPIEATSTEGSSNGRHHEGSAS